MENILKTAICSIPDFNTGRMSRDKSVEDRIVKDAETGIFVCQMVIDGLIVVIEDQTAAAYNDSLRRLCHSQGMNLIQAAVKSLGCRVGSHVPHTNHSRDICTDDLLSSFDPLYANQTVIVTLHDKDFPFDLGVPHVDIVVETSTKDHVHVCIPVKSVHSQLMTLLKFVLQCKIIHLPECNDSVHST